MTNRTDTRRDGPKASLSQRFRNLPPWVTQVGQSLFALVAAFAVGGLLIALIGRNPIDAYGALLQSSFGDGFALGETLESATPLIFTGLALAIGFQARLLNIGAEGQFLMGALAAVWVAINVSAPGVVLVILALAAAAMAGGLWAGIAGVLKATRQVHEVISTIMLNFIAIFFINFMVTGPMQEVSDLDIPQTAPIDPSVELPRIFPPSRLSAGFLIALAAAFGVWWLIRRAPLGYELRAVGHNAAAASQAGIVPGRITVLAMAIGGAMAGLGGGVVILGLLHRFPQGYIPGFGFTAIAISLLGRNTVPGVIAASVLFGALAQGARGMQTIADVPRDTLLVIQALVIFFVSAPHMFSFLRRRPSPAVQEGSE